LESDDQRREEGLGAKDSQELIKHGTHDQQSHGNWAASSRRAEAIQTGEIPGYVTDSAGRIVNPDATGGYKAGIPEKVVFAGEEFTPNHSLWHHLVSDGKGGFEPSQERAYLHQQIINKLTNNIPESDNPTFTMLGGGPASGKSTVLKSGQVDVPAKGRAVQINSDDIKEMLPENPRMRASNKDGDFFRAAEFVHEESSILAKRVQNRAIKNNQDIVLDGTGDSSINKLAKKINEARDSGYKVNGVYVTIPTEMAWQRSSSRALSESKRYVPEQVVRDTHQDVSQTFPLAVQGGLFDTVSLWDNSGTSVKLIGSGSGSNFNVLDNNGYQTFLAKGDE
jgi:predicted ABC-type ATPase